MPIRVCSKESALASVTEVGISSGVCTAQSFSTKVFYCLISTEMGPWGGTGSQAVKLQAGLRGSMKQELAMQQMPTSGLANPTLPPRHHGCCYCTKR